MKRDELAERLHGVIAVMVSPFTGGTRAFDAAGAARLAQRCDRAGVHALTALGNTAEPHQLSGAERSAHLRAVADGAEQAALIAGLPGGWSDALQALAKAEALSYHAVMLHEPLDPLASEAGIVAFWHYLMDSASVPAIPYVRTARLSAAAMADAVSHPKVVAVKLARPRQDAAGLIEAVGARACTWVAGGAENQFLALRPVGVRGFTSGLANVYPELPLALWHAAQAGDAARVAELARHIANFEDLRTREAGRWNVAAVKAALAHAGMDVGTVRPPCEPLDFAGEQKLREIVDRWPAIADGLKVAR